MGRLVLQLKPPPGLGSASFTSPRVLLDGYQLPVQWGTSAVPVHPGRHQLRCAVSYLYEYGSASTELEIRPGQDTQLHYTSPVWAFSPGGLGPEPQPRRGWPGLIAVLAVIVAIPVLVVLLAVLLG